MLDTTEKNLLEEIDACMGLQKAYCKRGRDIIDGMIGFDARSGRNVGKSTPENHAFEYQSLMLGRLVADNPAVALRSPMAEFKSMADALEDAANQWITRTNLHPVLQGIVAEMLVIYGVGKVGYEEDPDAPQTKMGTRRMRPTFEHIPYWRFFRDYRACNGVKDRLKGHWWIRDRSDLEKDERYDPKMLKKLFDDAGLEAAGEVEDAAKGPSRHEIVGYEVWVPDAEVNVDEPKLRSQFHGKVYTLATVLSGVNDDPKTKKLASGFLRKPEPFFGPEWGPYVHFNCWPVPGSPYPLAPLMAVKDQAEEHTAQLLAVNEAVLNRKTVVITGASNTGLRNTLKNARDGSVHGVKGYQTGQFDQVEIGGPSTQQLDSEERSRERLDRNLGMSDAQRGNPTAGITASADNIAAQSASVRNDTMSGFVQTGVQQLMRSVCWYMCHSPFFVASLSENFAAKYQMKKPVFSGGEHPSTEGLNIDDMIATLDIQPFSMERVDPIIVQGRLAQLVPLAIQMAQAQVAMPYADYQPLWEAVAHAYNAPLMKNFVNKEQAQQFSQQQAQSAMQMEQMKLQSKQQAPQSQEIPYDSAPGDVKTQLEMKAGLQPSRVWQMTPPFDPNQPRQSGKGEPGADLANRMLGSKPQQPKPAGRAA